MLFLIFHAIAGGMGSKQPWPDDWLGHRFELLRASVLASLNKRFYLKLTEEEIEDALHSALQEAASGVSAGKKLSSIQGYLYRAAANRCIDTVRAKARKDSISLDDDVQPRELSSEQSVSREVISAVRVKEILAPLSEYERLILTMYVLDGYTYKEISAYLALTATCGKGEAQVCRDVHSVLRKLRNNDLLEPA